MDMEDNEKLHYQKHPGAETPFEYEQIMNNILNKLEMTNPEDLLPKDQYILGVDPEKLINTSPDGRQAWLANFKTAVAAELTARICNSNVLNDDYSVIVMN